MAHDQVYGDDRARRLVALLRAMAARIVALNGDEDLLAASPELMKLMGDARSELFHYEVRSTYYTPEVADSRRIVGDARQRATELDFTDSDEFDIGDDLPWQE